MLSKRGTLAILTLALGVSTLAALTVRAALGMYSTQSDNSGNTFTSAACFSGNTGYLNPSANAADSGGDNDGFELNPTNAYADGGGYASNINSPGDRHRFYNYNVSVNSNCEIKGIAVRLDWWLDDTQDETNMSVELSWDGGTNWTALKTDTEETTSEHTAVLGSSTDTWGRTWSIGDLTNANFRVRVSTYGCCSSTWSYRDFFLDWAPVTVYYGPS